MWLKLETGNEKGRTIPIDDRQFVIGRDEDCDLVLDDDERVSRRHARLESLDSGGVVLRDLGSTNGTFVGGSRIGEPLVLEGGEHIQIGRTEIAVSIGEPVPVTMIDRSAVAPPATPAGARRTASPPTPSAIERSVLRRSVKRSTIIASVTSAIVIVLVVLLIAGVFSSSSSTASTADVVAAARPSVVRVNTLDSASDAQGSGTGWVLDADKGLIVTNHHVIASGSTFTVDVGNSTRDAKIVGAAPCSDIALLQVDNSTGLRTLPMSSQKSITAGDAVVALGFPGTATAFSKLPFAATTGVVSAVHTRFDARELDPGTPSEIPVQENVVQTDAAINHGNSGGPLLTYDGRLVGVNTYGLSGSGRDSQNFAIGVDAVKALLPRLERKESPGWTGLNFAFLDAKADQQARTKYHLPLDASGILILGAIPGTPASAAGFDSTPALLAGVNGTPVTEMPDYCAAVQGLSSGQIVKLDVYLPGDPTLHEVQVDLA